MKCYADKRDIVKGWKQIHLYISTYNAENALGAIKATLKQFTVYETDNTQNVAYKLYQTDEGNWYDLTDNNSTNPFLLTSIKMAIDEAEQERSLFY